MRRTVIALMLVLAVVGGIAGGAAGCTRKTASGIATAGGARPDAAKSSASAPPADFAEQARQFARCMREQGVDMPDPESAGGGGDGGGMSIRLGDPANGGPDKALVDAAMKQCKHLLPNGGEPPKLDPAQVEQMRQFAKCMREHGISDFPDPGDGGGIMIQGAGPGSDLDPNSAKFKAAQQACEKYAPSPGAGGGPVTNTNGGGE
jgi:hypothetical protein